LFAVFCLVRPGPAIPLQIPREPQGLRLGVTATKALGGAVVRNRIKRRLREAFRMHRSTFTAPCDIVINPKRAAVDATFVEIEHALMKVIARLQSQLGTRASTEPQ
jgi:ribonuclease P protein component